MAESKTYLNVPYAQKDEAKALGARWDPTNKKWYVPANKDMTLFAKWLNGSGILESSSSQSNSSSRTPSGNGASSANNGANSVMTHPTIKDFVAYNGDEPPWD